MSKVRTRLTLVEREQLQALQVREKQANATLADPKTLLYKREAARRALNKILREKEALEAQIAGRVQTRREKADAAESDQLLSETEAEFPPIRSANVDWATILSGSETTSNVESVGAPEDTPLTVEEITEHLARVRTRLTNLKETPATRAARIYLLDQSNTLNHLLHVAKETEKEQVRLEKEEQANRDFLAAENAVREWREKLSTRLAAGFLPLPEREAIRVNSLRVAAQYRAMQREAGKTVENGVHVAAILAAKADFFERAAGCLAIFDCDLIYPESINDSDAELFGNRLAFSPAYFNFRTRDEKAKLVWRARRYFTAVNDVVGLSQVPCDVPDPVVIPNKPLFPLEVIERYDMQQLFDALKPLEDQSLEVIYRVEAVTLDNPRSPALLLWSDGREVDIHREVIWDKKAGGFRRLPEPAEIIEPKWGSGQQRLSWEQDLEGDWVRVAVNEGIEFEQDLTGSFVRKPSGQWKQSPLITIKQGDHRPPADDPRQFFRSGHWWTAEDIEQASRVSFNLKMAESQPVVADQTIWPRNESTPISSEEMQFTWRKHEQKIKSNLKEREKQHV